MKVQVQIKDKTFEISCGKGVQDLAWLALNAAYLYGKETYPPGSHMPTYLTTENGLTPHPRRRINAALQDSQKVFVTLKDPTQPADKSHTKWFEKAFGQKRNIMKCNFRYSPRTVDFKEKHKDSEVYLRFAYTMHKELSHEFSPGDYPTNPQIQLFPTDSSRRTFANRIEFPFGKVEKLRVFEVTKQQKELAENPEPRELPAEENPYAEVIIVPEPWSKAQQKAAMIQEEQEHRKKEEEAVRKAQEKIERALPKPKETPKSLAEVWPEGPGQLAPHFGMLQEVYEIYANLNSLEEGLMCVQDFVHFLRAFDLIGEMGEIMQVIVEIGSDIEDLLEDTLNPSITLRSFLEFLAKFSQYRYPSDSSFKELPARVEASKTAWQSDYVKEQLLKPEIFELIAENRETLSKKYLAKSSPVEGIRQDLRVENFIAMVQEVEEFNQAIDSGLLQQICEDTIFFSSAKDSQLLFADFSETLVRLAQTVPFNEEEIQENLGNESETAVLAEKLYSVIRLLCSSASRPNTRGLSRG